MNGDWLNIMKHNNRMEPTEQTMGFNGTKLRGLVDWWLQEITRDDTIELFKTSVGEGW